MTYIKDICPNSQILSEKLHKFDQKMYTFQQYLCDFEHIFEGNPKCKQRHYIQWNENEKSVSVKLHIFTSKTSLLAYNLQMLLVHTGHFNAYTLILKREK